MARPRRRIGVVSPVVVQGGRIGRGPTMEQLPPIRVVDLPQGKVALGSEDPVVLVIATLGEEGVTVTGGGPRNDERERPGEVSMVRFVGVDPLRIDVSLVLRDSNPRDVMAKLEDLEALGRPLKSWRLPEIRLYGWPPYGQRRWTRDGALEFDDDPEPMRTPEGWLRIGVTVPLVELTADRTLQHSVRKSRESGRGARNGPQFTRVKEGENGFGDVSKRLFKTRSRAGELARANSLPVGQRLKVGQRLRVP
jgi:hypothetical protein